MKQKKRPKMIERNMRFEHLLPAQDFSFEQFLSNTLKDESSSFCNHPLLEDGDSDDRTGLGFTALAVARSIRRPYSPDLTSLYPSRLFGCDWEVFYEYC